MSAINFRVQLTGNDEYFGVALRNLMVKGLSSCSFSIKLQHLTVGNQEEKLINLVVDSYCNQTEVINNIRKKLAMCYSSEVSFHLDAIS